MLQKDTQDITKLLTGLTSITIDTHKHVTNLRKANGAVTVFGNNSEFRIPESKEAIERFREYCLNGSGRSETFLHKEGDVGVGGSFVPVDFQTEISMGLPAFSPIRGIVNVRQSRSLHYEIPRIKGATSTLPSDFVTSWKGEGMDISDTGAAIPAQSTPTTQLLRITSKLLTADVVVLTRELMQDAPAFNEALPRVFASHFAQALENSYLLGTGVTTGPRGILTHMDTDITSVTIGSGTSITYAGLISLYTSLPPAYRERGTFVFNSQFLGKLLGLVGSTNDHPLISSGLMVGRLWGRPIVISDHMPNVATGVGSAIFGDFSFYRAVDRFDMEVIRLVERYAPHVGLLPFGRFGGAVEEFQAFRIGKTS